MSGWVELYVTYDQLEAEMIKDILESGGIEVVIQSAKLTPYPVNVGRMGEVKLLVKEEDKEAAEEIIKTTPQEGFGTGQEEEGS
jgi:Putative prokaryotic signal transducing protein